MDIKILLLMTLMASILVAAYAVPRFGTTKQPQM